MSMFCTEILGFYAGRYPAHLGLPKLHGVTQNMLVRRYEQRPNRKIEVAPRSHTTIRNNCILDCPSRNWTSMNYGNTLEQRRFDSLHVTNELHLAFRMYISCFHRRDSSCAINSYTPHVHVTSFGTWNGMVSPFCCCKAGEASHTEQKLSEQLIRVITRYYERETWWEFWSGATSNLLRSWKQISPTMFDFPFIGIRDGLGKGEVWHFSN